VIAMEYSCRAIGVARTPFTDPAATPIQAAFSTARGTVEVSPEYRDGLSMLVGFSHIHLIYRFHRVAAEELAERPLIDGAELHGIFATRPIGGAETPPPCHDMLQKKQNRGRDVPAALISS